MLLLATRNLAELLLWYALDEAVQASKDLVDVLGVDQIHIRPPDELLDAGQAVADQMGAKPLIDLAQHPVAELGVLAGLEVEDLVHVAAPLQGLGVDALAHDEGFVGASWTKTDGQGTRRAALGDQPERGEGRQQECVGCAVDEVGKAGEGGSEADDWPVEADDEDLWVRGEGSGSVEVEGDERAQPQLVRVGFGRWGLTGAGDVGATVTERERENISSDRQSARPGLVDALCAAAAWPG